MKYFIQHILCIQYTFIFFSHHSSSSSSS